MTAYWVVYINEEQVKALRKFNIYNYKSAESGPLVVDQDH